MKYSEFSLLADYIYNNFGIKISDNKMNIFEMKLSKLIKGAGVNSIEEYYTLLNNPKEKSHLIDFLNEITINKTDFFREINHFNYIRDNISEILRNNKRISIHKEIRVWSAACSTGEEPYTIAMILKEYLPSDITIKILATDISHKVLEQALKAQYKSFIKEQVPPIFLNKYFIKLSTGYRVTDEIRQMVTFRSFNLKEHFPFKGTFDIIFCRNVMIYFDNTFHKELAHKFYQNLHKGGLLFIGHSESFSHIPHNFQYVQPTVYLRK